MKQNKKTRKSRRTIVQIREPYRYISMLSDYGFKQTFGNEKNTLFLRKAIQILLQLDTPIKTVEFVKNEKSGITIEGRGTLFDVVCKDAKGTVYIVEMQLNEVTHFFQRAKFYALHIFNTMVQKGNKYKFNTLKPIYVISFLAENAFTTKHYYQVGQIKNQYGEVMDDQTTYIVVELKKWNKTKEDITTDLDKLIYFMKTTEFITKEEDFKEPEFFEEDWLQAIIKELDLIRMSPEKRMVYELEMARRGFEEMIAENKRLAALEKAEKEKMEALQQAEKEKMEALQQAEKEKIEALQQAEKEKMEALQQAEKEKIEALQQEQQKQQEDTIKKLLLSNTLTIEQIAQIMNFSIEKVKTIQEELEQDH